VLIKIIFASALVISAVACTGSEAKPAYRKAAVQPLTVIRLSGDEIGIRYHVYPESGHYSNGVDYRKVVDELQVVIIRCDIAKTCNPMVKTVIPLDQRWEAEVHLPYHGEKVVVMYSDGDETIYPSGQRLR
jgi:hypothetical protein